MLPARYTYLLVDVLCLFFPLVFSFHHKIKFYKHWPVFLISNISVAVFFIAWDIIFTRLGVWAFNGSYTLGIYFVNLPLEELLFFFCIPYSCLFSYCAIKKILPTKPQSSYMNIITVSLSIILSAIAIIEHIKWYTSVTFGLLGILLFVCFRKRVAFMPVFYLTFLLILLPFFISNGILTGSMIQAPVVLYNNSYNLGIRLLTIPVEDIFYGMLLQLLNVIGFEYFEKILKPTPLVEV